MRNGCCHSRRSAAARVFGEDPEVMTARTDIDSDRLIAALDARVDRREQRRAFFRDALGAMAVTGALGLASGASAQSTPTPPDRPKA